MGSCSAGNDKSAVSLPCDSATTAQLSAAFSGACGGNPYLVLQLRHQLPGVARGRLAAVQPRWQGLQRAGQWRGGPPGYGYPNIAGM